MVRVCLTLLFAALAACASPSPHKVSTGTDEVKCAVEAALKDEQCFNRTPEVSAEPGRSYTLHFVEFDDQGWLYPAPEDKGYVPEMGSATASSIAR
jgi:hypothetical protein